MSDNRTIIEEEGLKRETRMVEVLDGDHFPHEKHIEVVGKFDNLSETHYEDDRGFRDYDKHTDGMWKKGRHPNSRHALFQKGHSYGGRKKGSKNKRTIRQELLENGGLTPAQFLATLVNDESLNINQRIRAAEASAKFYDASLASVEMHTDDDKEAPFNIFLAGQVPKEILEAMENTNSKSTDDDEEE